MVTAADVERIYASLPPAERKLPAVVVDGRAYTWEEVIQIIRAGGSLAERILNELSKIYG